jgi:hypothetical protein
MYRVSSGLTDAICCAKVPGQWCECVVKRVLWSAKGTHWGNSSKGSVVQLPWNDDGGDWATRGAMRNPMQCLPSCSSACGSRWALSCSVSLLVSKCRNEEGAEEEVVLRSKEMFFAPGPNRNGGVQGRSGDLTRNALRTKLGALSTCVAEAAWEASHSSVASQLDAVRIVSR